MLIKDIVIKDRHGKVEFYAEVIIKRGGKFYSVPVRVESRRNDLIETLDYALEHCRGIDENWLVPKEDGEVVEHLRDKVIKAVEIEL